LETGNSPSGALTDSTDKVDPDKVINPIFLGSLDASLNIALLSDTLVMSEADDMPTKSTDAKLKSTLAIDVFTLKLISMILAVLPSSLYNTLVLISVVPVCSIMAI